MLWQNQQKNIIVPKHTIRVQTGAEPSYAQIATAKSISKSPDDSRRATNAAILSFTESRKQK